MLEKPLAVLAIGGKISKFTRNETCMQEHLFEHLNGKGNKGFLENVSITLTDKSDGQDPKKRENYWKRKFKTYVPFGLTVKDTA